jgi:hypothetical protein
VFYETSLAGVLRGLAGLDRGIGSSVGSRGLAGLEV